MTVTPFNINFPNGNIASAVRVQSYTSPDLVAQAMGFSQPQPALFISGGAGNMSDEDMRRTRIIVEQGIVKFAAEHNVVIIDGGTEAGIMQIVGEARAKIRQPFTLIGCAPEEKVTFPGSSTGGDKTRTPLESHHSHFALVEADFWGAESDLIVGLTRAITQYKQPAFGILINGGKIAQYDVYIASARGKEAMPVVVINGSGRSANVIATASKTGQFSSAMIKAIVQGGKIEVVELNEGPDALYRRLIAHFEK